jgi:hypothetical protein
MKLRPLGLSMVVALSLAGFAAGLWACASRASAGEWLAAPVMACVAAAFFYAVSHVMRATRLAVIAMPFLGISFRSGLALHLFVAPWSILMPFKLDELIRYNELCRLSRSPARAFATILIDRSMDGVILIGLACYMLAAGYPEVAGFVGLAGVGLTVLALGFIILPPLLETTQRHIFTYNHSDTAFYALKRIDRLRQLLFTSRQAITGAAPFLLITTLGIWAMEMLAVWTLVRAAGFRLTPLAQAAELMLDRANSGWQAFLPGIPADPLAAGATMIFFVALLLLWIPAAVFYTARQKDEPRRPRLPQRTGFSVLPTAHRI